MAHLKSHRVGVEAGAEGGVSYKGSMGEKGGLWNTFNNEGFLKKEGKKKIEALCMYNV